MATKDDAIYLIRTTEDGNQTVWDLREQSETGYVLVDLVNDVIILNYSKQVKKDDC